MNLFADIAFRKVISSSGINLFFRLVGLALSFFITIIVNRLFGLDAWGNYSLIFIISQAASMIFALGFPNAMIKVTGEKRLTINQSKSLLLQAIKIVLCVCLIPMLIFYIGANFLAIELFHNTELIYCFKILSISLPFLILQEIFLYYFIAIQNFRRFNIFMFVLPNMLLISFILLLYLLNLSGFWIFMAYSSASIIIVIIEAILVFNFKIPKAENILSLNELYKTASPMMFSGLTLFLLNWTVIIMLGLMVNNVDVGIYNIAFRISNVGLLVITSISTITTPKIAELYGKNELPQLKKLIHSSTRLIAILSVPAIVIILIFQNPILSFFGEEVNAQGGGLTLTIISVGVLFSALSGTTDQILNMTGDAIVLKKITIFCFFVNIGLNYFLIKDYGINGAATASLVTNVLLNLICLVFIKKKLGYFTLF